MAFIKVQKLVRDENGKIISGSAAIVESVYGNYGSYHSKQSVREKLGKVISLSEDKKSGIFLSPTRGMVEYDSVADVFREISRNDPGMPDSNLFPEALVHTVFGDVFLLIQFLEKAGLISIFRAVFPKDSDYERLLCHVLHGILRDGSRIGCDDFIEKSFASYFCRDVPYQTLRTDSHFFAMMGDDRVRMSFFKAFIAMMQEKDPSFGKGCYVDSTPLPNDIDDNPFNALCCHGVGSSEVMTRLVLVLDEASGLPVWFDIIPGNVLDINTVMIVVNDVAESLGIEIDSLTLDCGYVSEELLRAFHIGTDKTVIGRMPNRRGYPYKTLYWKCKDLIGKGKYAFVRRNHAYFGKREVVELFGQKEYAYVYVDQYNALKRFSNYLTEHEDDFQELTEREKNWLTVKNGYFVLISNIETSPKELLSLYFGRTDIETVFKTSKEYLNLLPLSKWSDLTVRGKILHDIIDTIILLLLRKFLKEVPVSTTSLFGKTQSLMCFRNGIGTVTIETPSKMVKKYYSYLDVKIPVSLKIDSFMKDILRLRM